MSKLIQRGISSTPSMTLFILLVSLLLIGQVHADSQQVIKQCESCHGSKGNSQKKDIPSIASFSVGYSQKVMKAFKADKRQGKRVKATSSSKETSMNEIAKQVNSNDLKAAYTYFSKQKFVPARQPSNPTLAKKGQKVYNKRCMKCHGDTGADPEDDAAILKGQWIPYLRAQMKEFQENKRPMHKKMKQQIKRLKPKDLEPLMHFFAQPA